MQQITADRYLLGIDLGTSGVKALLLAADGRPSSSVTVPLALSMPRPGWAEQDPEAWWEAAVEAIRTVLRDSDVEARDILGLAVSGQMHGATLLDGDGEVVRPCILWNDQRSGRECDLIVERVGRDGLLAAVGNPALAGFTLPKLLWIREHEPQVWDRVRTVLLPKDYLNYRLTGTVATDVSDASGTLLFDVKRRCWSEKVAGALDIPLGILPAVHESIDVIGEVNASAAAATGLRTGTPVISGGADNACAAVGAGVIEPGQVLVSLGTSGTLVAPTAEPRSDPAGRLHTFCHAIPNRWYDMGVVLSAGGSLRWFCDTIGEPERRCAEATGRDPYEVILEEAATAPPGSEGLIFLPYLTGERTPHGDPLARGVYFGLSLRHSRAHLVRSVIEGISYALADSADLMRALGSTIEVVRVTGGGSRSEFWRQILADVLEAAVMPAAGEAGPALGAAILAGAGAGVFPSIAAATERLVSVGPPIGPDPVRVARYRAYRALYDSLYPALRNQFGTLGALLEE